MVGKRLAIVVIALVAAAAAWAGGESDIVECNKVGQDFEEVPYDALAKRIKELSKTDEVLVCIYQSALPAERWHVRRIVVDVRFSAGAAEEPDQGIVLRFARKFQEVKAPLSGWRVSSRLTPSRVMLPKDVTGIIPVIEWLVLNQLASYPDEVTFRVGPS